jgi:hypothetical protein
LCLAAQGEFVPPRHHKAGLVGPAFFAWNWFRSVLFRPPAQNVKKLCLIREY